MAEEDEERPFEPSAKKLEDARRRGEVPRSADLTGAIAAAGFLLVALFWGGAAAIRLGELGVALIGQADRLSGGAALPMAGFPSWLLALELARALGPVLLLPGALVIAGLVAQRALVFAPEKLSPKLSRISPIENAKNRYGRAGLFEFFKSAVKLVVISTILFLFLRSRAETIAASMTLEPGGVARMLGRTAIEFLLIVVAVWAVIGGLDFLWQVQEHRRRNRMSLKELRDETKEAEGDPHFKQARRRRGQEIALNAMLADVPKAAVVIVNPEHYAVALSWDRSHPGAPVCVAKGVDEIAAQIRRVAAEAGVPIHRDPPTARALHATTEIGEEIPRDHYRAAAAAIRFAEAMRKAARARFIDGSSP